MRSITCASLAFISGAFVASSTCVGAPAASPTVRLSGSLPADSDAGVKFASAIADMQHQLYPRAAKQLSELALQGMPEAAYNLSILYDRGLGVPRKPEKAVYLLREAAAANLPEAEFALGVRTATGQGMTKNDAEAARLYQAAAVQGHPAAAFNLGYAYKDGAGVPQHLPTALAWFRKAASEGFPGAGDMVRNIELRVEPAELAEADRLSSTLDGMSASTAMSQQRGVSEP